MLVKATRFFISSVFGNVEPGQILETSDVKGKQLINSGLAGPYASPLKVSSPFQSPVTADQSGSVSPADQVSQKKTVDELNVGGQKKVTFRKKEKLP